MNFVYFFLTQKKNTITNNNNVTYEGNTINSMPTTVRNVSVDYLILESHRERCYS